MNVAPKTTMVEVALCYASLGLPVFPCNPKAKAPLVGGGFHAATTDTAQISAWWTKWPTAMIALPTGLKSGIDVLDLDFDDAKGKNGLVAIPDWPERSSIIVCTPRGGRHLWFKSAGTVRNTTDTIAHGVDTRGVGGYAIVPPSKNGSAAYRFEKGGVESLEALGPFPPDLLERLAVDGEKHISGAEAEADPALIMAALAVIPNDKLGWEEWNRVGMAAWCATGGKAFAAFDGWSKKSSKYDAQETLQRWNHYFESPPNQIGAGTLFFMANEAAPGWQANYDAAVEEAMRNANCGSSSSFASEPGADGKPQLVIPGTEVPNEPTAAELATADPARSATKSTILATPFVFIDPTRIPKRRWVYKPHYVRQFLSLTVSTGGVGKSSLVVVEALAMATGRSLLNIKPERVLRCWYWNGEDPMDELQRRFAAAAKHYGLRPEDIGDRLFVDSGRTMPIVIAAEDARRSTRIAEPVINDVIGSLRDNQIDVFIVDPFVSCHRVSENDNAAIERVAKSWSHVAEAANCAVMLVHHSRKTGGEGVTVDDGRGASALLAAARTARTLNTMTKPEAENAEIEERERRLHFRSDIGKANLTRPAEIAEWFRLVSVDLENPGPDADWCEGDHVGVVTAWNYPRSAAPNITTIDIGRVQDAIKAGGPWRFDQRSERDPWVGIPVAKVLGLDLLRRGDKRAVVKLVSDWLQAGLLVRVEGQDRRGDKHQYVKAGDLPWVERPSGAIDA